MRKNEITKKKEQEMKEEKGASKLVRSKFEKQMNIVNTTKNKKRSAREEGTEKLGQK